MGYSGSCPNLPCPRGLLQSRFIWLSPPSAGDLVPAAISLSPPLDGRTSLASSMGKGPCNLIQAGFFTSIHSPALMSHQTARGTEMIPRKEFGALLGKLKCRLGQTLCTLQSSCSLARVSSWSPRRSQQEGKSIDFKTPQSISC